ncbi:hypothetical protein [Mycobacterium sp. EPa45]|uniref:hypothetical protein n=1 Tax=Mycobacterium sp. EPa45 TaxID=1545728 RepID=UPI0006422B77|nr:hypothetical protein [Mycobacterium sp. EPa45]AKK27438.1 hypothetical protein AB431_13005 [Mycobacterium sp. EPa45]
MGVGIRRLGSAGVALTAACAIVVSPVVPADEALAVSPPIVSAVNLAAAQSPIAVYGDLLDQTVMNATAVLTRLVKDPTPILTNIATNQIEHVKWLGESAFMGFWIGAYGGALGLISGRPDVFPVAIAYFVGSEMTRASQRIGTAVNDNLAAVAAQLPAAGSVIDGALTTPLLAAGDGAHAIADDIAEAVKSHDLVSLTHAIVDAPAVMVNAIVNGRCGVTSCAHPGLLTPETGSIASVLAFRDSIAGAIKPFTGVTPGSPGAVDSARKAATTSPAGGHSARKASASAHSKRAAH